MGNYLSEPVLEKDIEEGIDLQNSSTPVSWAVVDMQGWRKSMEDAHIAQTSVLVSDSPRKEVAHIFAVFDGHLGAEVARFSSLYLIDVLKSQPEWQNGKDIGKALVNSFHCLDRMIADERRKDEILELQTKCPERGSSRSIRNSFPIPSRSISDLRKEDSLTKIMKNLNSQFSFIASKIVDGKKTCNLPDFYVNAGCTATCAVIFKGTLYVANAGDSRAVLGHAGGETTAMSFDHKPRQEKEMNRIHKAGGFVNQFGRVNGNLNLSRAIGDLKYKQVPDIPPSEQIITAEPDIKKIKLRDDDEFIIIACDGVWEGFGENEKAVKYVADRINETSPKDIGIEMINDATSPNPRMTKGIGCDNMTVVIIDLQPRRRAPLRRKQRNHIFKKLRSANKILPNRSLQKIKNVIRRNKSDL